MMLTCAGPCRRPSAAAKRTTRPAPHGRFRQQRQAAYANQGRAATVEQVRPYRPQWRSLQACRRSTGAHTGVDASVASERSDGQTALVGRDMSQAGSFRFTILTAVGR
jgi:hypothetical protein